MMSMCKDYIIAIDIGASSGRLIAGYLEDGQLITEEIYRFKNSMSRDDTHYTWDIESIMNHIYTGLKNITGSKGMGSHIKSIGVDMWGVDYVLLNEKGLLQDKAYAYRDARTDSTFEQTIKHFERKQLYERTGIQFLAFNTLYQLKAHMLQNPDAFTNAKYFLMLPDYFHYRLSGQFSNEFTELSTTQMVDSSKNRNMDNDLIDYIGIESSIFPERKISGDILGKVSPSTVERTGINPDALVTIPGTHDTACAIAASIGDKNSAYIISGTWSIVGTVTDKPVINEKAYEYEFSNEGGVYTSNNLLKNIIGMWIIDQVMKETVTEQDKNITFPDVITASEKYTPFKILINPNDDLFMNPVSMIEAIRDFTKNTNQDIPSGIGEMARCIYDSLALMYYMCLMELEEITGKVYSSLNIMGGGSKNHVLNQLIANVTRREVLAGPIENSAIGNIVIQMISLGMIKDLHEAKKIIKQSEKTFSFQGNKIEGIDDIIIRFKNICNTRK